MGIGEIGNGPCGRLPHWVRFGTGDVPFNFGEINRMLELRNWALIYFPLFLPLLAFVPQLAASSRDGWIASWAASPQPAMPYLDRPLLQIEDRTVRQRVRLSLGGSEVRL